MSGNCTEELNRQIQGLSARLSQAENNITSHYYGISMAIQGLAANPLTAGSVASVAGIYNLVPAGFEMLQQLISNINPADFKKMMMAMAAGLIDTMSAELDAMADMMIDQAEAMLEMVDGMIGVAEGIVTAAEDTLASTITAIGNLPADATQQAIDLATAARDTAQSALDAANFKLDNLKNTQATLENSLVNMGDFMTSQSNIGKCISGQMVIGN